jgi:hypothetical protein
MGERPTVAPVGREPLSPGARSLISAHIDSVRRLELLLLLRDRRDERWTAATVAASLRVAPGWTTRELEALTAGGLLALAQRDQATYRYAAQPEDEQFVGELADAYRRRKSTVVQAILSAMDSDVQALSDAFRLRDRSDG